MRGRSQFVQFQFFETLMPEYYLQILDCIGDKGLEVIAIACVKLQELKVFPSMGVEDAAVTEKGLVTISVGCPKLQSMLYFCQQMTNAILITIAKNCPHCTRFKRLCILDPKKSGSDTLQPLNEGSGAIV
ncbi:hypothetical protein GIB67_030306 [Kingdonia uniflora]|uniref:Uncharacterized protein n=1 Tax=Kingdonia uniflora TaxID=39325 RepID=A0A7J7M6K6_9MAGN|nr:hypothetical protein GIB67_030306 [Kingdonia uniflora]